MVLRHRLALGLIFRVDRLATIVVTDTVPDPDVGAGLGPLILLAKAQSFLTGQGRRRHGAKADVVAVVDVDHRKTSLRRSWTASKKRTPDWYTPEARFRPRWRACLSFIRELGM